MTYYLYHIPGKKIGVTRDLKERVENQQGYNEDEYTVLMESDDIQQISVAEISMQKAFGYPVDRVPYNKLKFNVNMKINITEQTTTFPCPINKLKGRLMDNMEMEWQTIDGSVKLTAESIRWIMKNVKVSMYNEERCYIYNKAFSRWFDNNDPYPRTGALAQDCGIHERQLNIQEAVDSCGDDYDCAIPFEKIRIWADERGLYDKGDPKTQTLKLMEEAGEICRAVLKNDESEIIDGIGDCVVVLTNLAHLCGTSIENCIDTAYDEIKNRKGKMVNGTFKKD
jgi:NTP pyrophosphatase (non-canonical NTP hydrolase)|tara:strand:+ start:928 stop:1773 length:846 start_codon:yes stop_codon:yes gene_type:complete